MAISRLSGGPVTITQASTSASYQNWVVQSMSFQVLPGSNDYMVNIKFTLSREVGPGLEFYRPSTKCISLRNVSHDFPGLATSLNTLTANLLAASSGRGIIN